MADYDFPKDLVEAQRTFYEAELEVGQLVATLPKATLVLEGKATISDEQRDALAAARARRGEALNTLYSGHKFWTTVDDRRVAKQALEQMVKTQMQAAESR